MKTSTIFVELDTLLDTRMSTLNSMGVQALKSALDAGYHDRPFDIFPGVDEAVYRQLYAKRGKSALTQAMMTPIVEVVKEFVTSTLDNVNNSPFHYKPKVMLNVYPYKLVESEIAVLIAALRGITLGLADIEAVDMSLEEITPLFVKANLSVMIMYQYDMWLEAHSLSGAFKKHTAPEVAMIGPRIYFKKPLKLPDPAEDPFTALEQLASPFIGLALLPIEKFSMVLKPVKKTPS